jgi:ubiquinone/menaquinone biosynthesis C-methylase UbiE
MKDRRPNPHPNRRRGPRPVSNPGVLRPDHKPPTPHPQSAIGNRQSPPTHWGDAADWYDALVGEAGSEYHRHVVLPGAIRLLAVHANEPVLDIACGQGVLCRLLARQNIPATGIDAAPDLIRMANDRNAQLQNKSAVGSRQSAGGENKSAVGSGQSAVKDAAGGRTPSSSSLPTADCPLPTYSVGDARDLSFLPENTFAAAACLLAIQNIHPIAPVFSAVARVLRPLGKFVIVMMHPAFRNPKETHWGWDDKEKVQYRRVDKYLLPRKVPIVTHPGKGEDYTWTFHKPLEAYVKAARTAGLLIDALEEWPSHKTSTSGPRAPAENTARKEIPMFLALRAVKIPTSLLPAAPAEGSDAPRSHEGHEEDGGEENEPRMNTDGHG